MPTTHALIFDTIGEPHEVLSVREIELPAPAAGHVTVAMEASPIDPTDLAFIRGRYVPPTLPGSGAGQSGVGRVVTLGDGVNGVRVGDRVVVVPNGRHQVWRQKLNVELSDLAV